MLRCMRSAYTILIASVLDIASTIPAPASDNASSLGQSPGGNSILSKVRATECFLGLTMRDVCQCSHWSPIPHPLPVLYFLMPTRIPAISRHVATHSFIPQPTASTNNATTNDVFILDSRPTFCLPPLLIPLPSLFLPLLFLCLRSDF